MKKLFNKKGVAAVPSILVVLVTVVIIMGVAGVANIYMADIVQDVTDDQTAGSTTEEIGNNSIDAQLALSEKNDSVANVTVAGIIIAVLLAAFGGIFLARRGGMF